VPNTASERGTGAPPSATTRAERAAQERLVGRSSPAPPPMPGMQKPPSYLAGGRVDGCVVKWGGGWGRGDGRGS